MLQTRWFLGGLLTLISLPALAIVDVAKAEIYLTGGLLVAIALLLPKTASRVPKQLFKWGTPFILAAVGADFFYSRGQFFDPMLRTLALLMLWRGLQQRTAREELQGILLGLFMILVAGVLTLELGFALQIILFTPIALLQLLVTTLSTVGGASTRATTASWQGFKWRRWLALSLEHLDFRAIGVGSALYALLIISSTLLFITLPRFDIGLNPARFQAQGRQTLSGFNERLQLGDLSNILEDNRIAFRVDIPEGPLDRAPYWRMLVLDEYENGGFRRSGTGGYGRNYHDQTFSFSGARDLPLAAPYDSDPAPWTFYLEPNLSRFLPLPGTITLLRFQSRQRIQHFMNENMVALGEVPGTPLFFPACRHNATGLASCSFREFDHTISQQAVADSTTRR
ncbi:MAG: DUF3488 domain-containing protein [Verrucomicrobia bacterium]|nr:DUF3488 domain-containing protein [Verrucomicrobiota bacterium]